MQTSKMLVLVVISVLMVAVLASAGGHRELAAHQFYRERSDRRCSTASGRLRRQARDGRREPHHGVQPYGVQPC